MTVVKTAEIGAHRHLGYNDSLQNINAGRILLFSYLSPDTKWKLFLLQATWNEDNDEGQDSSSIVITSLRYSVLWEIEM